MALPVLRCHNHPGDRARIIASLVSHHANTITEAGTDAYFTPVSCTSTDMVAEASLFISIKMPSQPYAPRHLATACRELRFGRDEAVIVSLRYEHLGNGGGFKKATPLEGAATQIGPQKVAEFGNWPKQPSIGCAVDEETVKLTGLQWRVCSIWQAFLS
jgi:hypothetical protein